MTKKKANPDVPNNLISQGFLNEIQACRPARLFINKQKKKGIDKNAFELRRQFLQLSPEKQMKYFQKSIDKFIQLLDDKNITEKVQTQGKLFEILLQKSEQKKYFEAINAPAKPSHNSATYYAELKKHDNNAKPWKLLTAEEKKTYTNMLKDSKSEYASQVKHFAENLPERLKLEYLSFVNQANPSTNTNGHNDESSSPAPISQRRKSAQPIPESLQTSIHETQQKLNRAQLDDLHKCKPDLIYYEKKVPEDERPTFANSTARNTYTRSLFNKLNEKKRHKFILKAIKKWHEYLETHSSVVENQIPTLHLMLTKNDDIHFYFTSLGLPERPPVSSFLLFNNERQQTDSQQNWSDLPQTAKDEYVKRLSKLKHEYNQKFIEFVETALTSDYMRLEFFRNIKHAAKDYEIAVKDRNDDKDDGQLKITQYLVKKHPVETDPTNEFDRIKQELLSTKLSEEQKKLVERLGLIMHKYIDDTTPSKKHSSKSKGSTDEANNQHNTSFRTSKQHVHEDDDDEDVVVINGEISSDNIEPMEEVVHKKKKKHKRDRTEFEQANTSITSNSNDKERRSLSSPPTKKRK